MPTNQPDRAQQEWERDPGGASLPEHLAWRYLSQGLEDRGPDQPPEEALAEWRTSTEHYLEGCRTGRISDHLDGIEARSLLLAYIDQLIADEDLRGQWAARADISGILRTRAPYHGIPRTRSDCAATAEERPPNALDALGRGELEDDEGASPE